MSAPKDGGPAFAHSGNEIDAAQPGMSLRDFLAAHALAGMFASETNDAGMCPPARGVESFASGCARRAYEYADAMLAERAKRAGGGT